MKKSKLLVLTLVTCLFATVLTGCGSKKIITQTAETFLQALVNADTATINELCTDTMISKHKLDMLDVASMEAYFYESMGVDKDTLNPEAQTAVTEFCQSTVVETFKDYSIISINTKGQVGTVHASVTGIPTDAGNVLESQEVSDKVNELITTYTESNMASLLEVYAASGEEAMTTQIYNDLIPQMLQIMQESLASIEPSESELIFYVKKINDKWCICDSME